jgi:hypothetical protein
MFFIREKYRVPAKRGARIRFSPPSCRASEGTIVASAGQYLRVRFDGTPWMIQTLHPTWCVEYL